MPSQANNTTAATTESQAAFWAEQQRIDALSVKLNRDERETTLMDRAAFDRAIKVGRSLMHRFEAEFRRLSDAELSLVSMLGETS